jgi:hypothetical protein
VAAAPKDQVRLGAVGGFIVMVVEEVGGGVAMAVDCGLVRGRWCCLSRGWQAGRGRSRWRRGGAGGEAARGGGTVKSTGAWTSVRRKTVVSGERNETR